MTATATGAREAIGEVGNPLGIEGIEFVEYATSRPQALGHVLETMGFRPVARHRSREVMLYRQGDMNIVVNAHDAAAARDTPAISAFALRVRDAGAAHRRALERGAWGVPIARAADGAEHPGNPRRRRDAHLFRRPLARILDLRTSTSCRFPACRLGACRPPRSPACTGSGWCSTSARGRADDWIAFYRELFGWQPVPDEERFGILPAGHLLQEPRWPDAAADRARPPDEECATSRCSGSASAYPTCPPQWRHCARAASSSSRPKACTPASAAR